MEILFENPLILIVLIGIISSLFKKAKGERPESPIPRPRQRPHHRQSAEPERAAMETSVEEALKEERQRQAERESRIEQENRKRKQQAEESMRALQNQRREAHSFRETASRPVELPAEGKKEHGGRFTPEKQVLIDGIIWSEILGPPRAKNPHRSIKQK